jgi:hypothetical protein
MWYYYNISIPSLSNSNNIDNKINEQQFISNTTNQIIEENITVPTNDSSDNQDFSLTLGTYKIQINKEILGENYNLYIDNIISFNQNNKFFAYLGESIIISGDYTTSNNIITCTANTFTGEYGPKQKINATISFKINSSSEIEIINSSESYKINIIDIVNNYLTDETKDMSLSPFVKGIKFVLSK